MPSRFAVVYLVWALLYRLRYALTRPSWLSEFASGLATCIWGGIAIDLKNHVGEDWPSVDLFLKISYSPLWGWIGIALGLGQMFAFSLIDRHWRKPWLRWCSAFVVAWIWAAIAIGIVQASDSIPPSFGAVFACWFINIYLIFRILPAPDPADRWLGG